MGRHPIHTHLSTLFSFFFFLFFFFFFSFALATHLPQPLYPPDLRALREIRARLYDLPGSFFFDSWNFGADPCATFFGVECGFQDDMGGALHRVRALNLGTGLADTPGLGGVLSPFIGNLTSLVQLSVSAGRINGMLPEVLGNLSHLRFLGISRNRFMGPIPGTLGDLVNLETVDLSFNRLTGEIPLSLAQLPNLKALVLAHNRLTGLIPAMETPELLHLDLRENALTGPLPALPASLTFLSLTQNNLIGGLDGVARLTKADHVDLSFNRLTGGVPPAIFQLPLASLLLQRNRLDGHVSPSAPVTIPHVDLSYNDFSGGISPLLATCPNLYLNNNRLEGRVPQAFVDKLVEGTLQNLYLQHNYLVEFKLDFRAVPLPPFSTLCLQYNCMEPPAKLVDSCPPTMGLAISRPTYQCNIH